MEGPGIGYDISGVAPNDDIVRLLHHFVNNDWFPYIISCCFGCKKAPGWHGAKIKQAIGKAHGFYSGGFFGREPDVIDDDGPATE
jgi:hypothetical protein